MHKLLLVDDSTTLVNYLRNVLKRWGYEAMICADGRHALEAFKSTTFDLLVTDVRMQPMGGLELLRTIRLMNSDIPAIVITAFADVGTAAESLRLGAFDYIPKPFDIADLIATMNRALAYHAATHGLLDLELIVGPYHTLGAMVAESQAMRDVCTSIRKVAPTESAVFILGERGTGRGLVARTIHEHSTRKDQEFKVLDCAHHAGALDVSFAHERATVFIKEINALPPAQQKELLAEIDRCRASVEHEADEPRFVISASNALRTLVESGRFDKDLFRELADAFIELKPLRERRPDILPLVHHFLRRDLGEARPVPKLELGVSYSLQHYAWPGNVHELELAVAAVLETLEGGRITKAQMPASIREHVGEVPLIKDSDLRAQFLHGAALKRFLRDKEKSLTSRVPQEGAERHAGAVRPKEPARPKPKTEDVPPGPHTDRARRNQPDRKI
ncbi:MAG: sigma-54-dependent Fis family transcriptional regulator [Kiritimatiellae bacterium]|nr:sigma-54-dependent Fis family transcriptional regulator [Kiritimatiellia bacterium]